MVRYLLIETSLDTHAKDMALGVVQPKDVAYYILASASQQRGTSEELKTVINTEQR